MKLATEDPSTHLSDVPARVAPVPWSSVKDGDWVVWGTTLGLFDEWRQFGFRMYQAWFAYSTNPPCRKNMVLNWTRTRASDFVMPGMTRRYQAYRVEGLPFWSHEDDDVARVAWFVVWSGAIALARAIERSVADPGQVPHKTFLAGALLSPDDLRFLSAGADDPEFGRSVREYAALLKGTLPPDIWGRPDVQGRFSAQGLVCVPSRILGAHYLDAVHWAGKLPQDIRETW